MRIGFDIDDTMSRHWPFFSLITRALVHDGHEVIVITFRSDRQLAAEELSERGILWSELVVADQAEIDTIGFAQWKGEICRRRGVELFFDDMPEVINHLPESTVGMMSVLPEQGLVYYD